MSIKILAQTGISIPDVYDLKGSGFGPLFMQDREIHLVHEMGHTIFSERLGATIRRQTTGAVLASTGWDFEIVDLPATPVRVLGVSVITDNSARLSVATVSLRQTASQREIPIFEWDANEGVITSDLEDNAGGAGNTSSLVPVRTVLPSLLVGSDSQQPMGAIAFRGSTTAFGAGDVTTVALIHIAFAQVGGISSYGLPIPGW